MPLSVGDKLGPYEILAPIGAGGMGEVYRARDTRLGRDVAIKISAERFSNRFEREAQAIAALNHPHICQLYDVGPDYLVMEFIDGKPVKGPLPIDQALDFARQILDALDAAHSKGITHRDLKPGNILITKAGVKLLDFGLAKTARISGPEDETVTTPLTADGVILGTLQYMSPEQVEGGPADPRSDIFAFGLVLYEMITGHMVFEGKSKASLIAAILKEQPRPMRELVPLTPKALDRIVQACLEKDPEGRWRSAHDIKRAIELISLDVPAAALVAQPRRNRWVWPAVAAVAVMVAIVAAAAAWALWRTAPPPVQSTRFQIAAPESEAFREYLQISPDGRKLAFTTTGPFGGLWVRDLGSVESRLLMGTQNASGPSWSPDSRYIAFGVGNQLKKVDASGGPAQTLCTVQNPVGASTWNKDGVILFGGLRAGPLRRVSAAGGDATQVTVLDREASHYWPSFLPDGRHFIFARRAFAAQDQGIFLGSLDLKPDQQPRERLVATNYGAVYVASPSAPGGYLFFTRESTLMVQRFDATGLKLAGEAVPIAGQVGIEGNGGFAVSPSGVLAYRASGGDGSQLVWFDRAGKSMGALGSPGRINDLSLSPDGKRVAVSWGNPSGGPINLWVIDVTRGVPTRFMFDTEGDSRPAWSPDGRRLAFASLTGGTIFSKDSTGVGNEESLLKISSGAPLDWSEDGKLLLYSQFGSSNQDASGLWILPLESGHAGHTPMAAPYIQTQFRIFQGQFSPGTTSAPRWVAYTSNESGQPEVYVQSFPAGAGKFQVSTGGGVQPRWRRDGKELFYVARDNKLMAVGVNTAPKFEAGAPKALFQTRIVDQSDLYYRYDVSADGIRFLIDVQEQVTNSAPITVVLNWEAGLKK